MLFPKRVVTGCFLVFVTANFLAAGAPQEVSEQAYVVEGLSGPAEILVDRWGVPHIYAETQYDAFFVQGFNAARDRLWQLDTSGGDEAWGNCPKCSVRVLWSRIGRHGCSFTAATCTRSGSHMALMPNE